MSNIRRFDDIRGKDEDSSDEKEKKQTWYTGGAGEGGSGLNVVAPNADHKKNIVNDVFESAKQHGAVAKYDEKEAERVKFQGTGRSLSGATVDGAQAAPGVARVVLTFFKDAFTIDEGEPRYYKDAANQGFLDEVNKGVVPRELQQQYGEELDVELIEKQGEEWKSQPKKFKAFTSGGNTLSAPSNPSAAIRAQPRLITVDSSLPTTTIQVRLHDGGRLVVKLNQSHTIGDVRAHIEASKPSGKAFELRSLAPPTLLSNEAQTVKDAGLLNASLVQRII